MMLGLRERRGRSQWCGVVRSGADIPSPQIAVVAIAGGRRSSSTRSGVRELGLLNSALRSRFVRGGIEKMCTSRQDGGSVLLEDTGKL